MHHSNSKTRGKYPH